uniref:Uncharacterized protein n=1 Tax=Pavo cristatus TaxID=9049 RepID=A0A8C9FT91_PAVCR
GFQTDSTFLFFFPRGRPISENSTSVMMTCIYISPENRFKYVWKILIPDKPASILPNDSAVVVVSRGTHSVTYQCETQENGSIIASVKYTVNAATGKLVKTFTVFQCYGLVFVVWHLIFMGLHVTKVSIFFAFVKIQAEIRRFSCYLLICYCTQVG